MNGMIDWGYVRNWGAILALTALGAALLWGLGYAVYLNRIGSRGWASTRRWLKTSLAVFSVSFLVATAFREGPVLWALFKGRLGSPEGKYRTGVLYLQGGRFLQRSPERAVPAFRRAADQGHTLAQFALARAYRYGLGTRKDQAEALRWAEAAAQGGHPLAMVLAGELLQDSSPAEAGSFFKRALPLLRVQGEAGDGQACFTLGFLYRQGFGVVPDSEEALYWMLLARRLGISPPQAFAVEAYGKSLPPDQQVRATSRAQAWLRAHGRPQAGLPIPPPGPPTQ
ncbi:tetratricopeptide repeat protein [Geothrix alkalitolerans]|uniref:tetratricopeptide repeat protein n=1 Tax=Geothrix alkalitolerans TaxID=2922724 RepID=UPI001FAEB9DB|nr:tetratricopeptide repeat protein [Geothrix alkalitolerans]